MTACSTCHQPDQRAIERDLSQYGDWMSLGEFASWGDMSPEIAKRTLTEPGIKHVRLGNRGQYRISTASVAERFGVPNEHDDETGVTNANQPPTSLAAVAPIPVKGRHAQS